MALPRLACIKALGDLEDLAAYAKINLAALPVQNRFIVSNHDSSYLAAAYDFEVVGTIIPSNSTLSGLSAADLVSLIEELKVHNMCTLFSESSLSDRFSQNPAKELGYCENVQVLALYTDALGKAGTGADSYLDAK